MYVAIFVFTEKHLLVRGPFATEQEAKEHARTMSTDPDEALVCPVRPPEA